MMERCKHLSPFSMFTVYTFAFVPGLTRTLPNHQNHVNDHCAYATSCGILPHRWTPDRHSWPSIQPPQARTLWASFPQHSLNPFWPARSDNKIFLSIVWLSTLSRAVYVLKIFFPKDIISLFIQAGGGGIASGNSGSGAITGQWHLFVKISWWMLMRESTGADIMLAGIAFQLGWYHPFYGCLLSNSHTLASLVIFSALSAEFFYRVYTDKPIRAVSKGIKSPDSSSISFTKTAGAYGRTRPVLIFVSGMAFSLTCLFIR